MGTLTDVSPGEEWRTGVDALDDRVTAGKVSARENAPQHDEERSEEKD
jgi:hypothetical protein